MIQRREEYERNRLFINIINNGGITYKNYINGSKKNKAIFYTQTM
jgi:hypothetical protein